MNKNRFEILEARFLKNPVDGRVLNDLAAEFRCGAPCDALREWLHAPNDLIVGGAMWIASELGRKATPLADEFPRFLQHHDRNIRFYALDCVFACASSGDEYIALAIPLLEDADTAVSWKAFQLFAHTPEGVLANSASSDTGYDSLLNWILSKPETEDIVMRMKAASSLERKLALVAAVRKGPTDDNALVAAARQSSDERLQYLASEELAARRA